MLLYDLIDFIPTHVALKKSINKEGTHAVQSQEVKNNGKGISSVDRISQSDYSVNTSISKNSENDTDTKKFSKNIPEGEKQIYFENFKEWFGNWQNYPKNASKAVNADGTPKVLYHGTDYKFTTFKSRDGNNEYFFTDSKTAAQDYGETQMTVYLRVQKPYIIDLKGDGDAAIYDAIDYAKGNKYEGVIAKNAYDGANTHAA